MATEDGSVNICKGNLLVDIEFDTNGKDIYFGIYFQNTECDGSIMVPFDMRKIKYREEGMLDECEYLNFLDLLQYYADNADNYKIKDLINVGDYDLSACIESIIKPRRGYGIVESGDLFKINSFLNKICYFSDKGEKVKEQALKFELLKIRVDEKRDKELKK